MVSGLPPERKRALHLVDGIAIIDIKIGIVVDWNRSQLRLRCVIKIVLRQEVVLNDVLGEDGLIVGNQGCSGNLGSATKLK